jgi:hypothetical protein
MRSVTSAALLLSLTLGCSSAFAQASSGGSPGGGATSSGVSPTTTTPSGTGPAPSSLSAPPAGAPLTTTTTPPTDSAPQAGAPGVTPSPTVGPGGVGAPTPQRVESPTPERSVRDTTTAQGTSTGGSRGAGPVTERERKAEERSRAATKGICNGC